MTNVDPSTANNIGDAELDHAIESVSRHLVETPLVRFHGAGGDVPVYLKLETTQPTGSFKVRGAIVAASEYASSVQPIVTASAGNHGLGIAWAAHAMGFDATVVVSRSTSTAKIDALRKYRINLVLEGDCLDEAEIAAKEIASRGGQFVSAYNDPYVIAGQATLAAEVSRQLSGDFTLVVPVGGGGLVAGSALAARRIERSGAAAITVVGVEAERSQGVSASVTAGTVVQVPIGSTVADGLAGNIEPSTITPAIAAAAGVTFLTADERSIREAMRELALSAGITAEGAAAVGLAALRSGALPHTATAPIVLVITGRNVAAKLLSEVLSNP